MSLKPNLSVDSSTQTCYQIQYQRLSVLVPLNGVFFYLRSKFYVMSVSSDRVKFRRISSFIFPIPGLCYRIAMDNERSLNAFRRVLVQNLPLLSNAWLRRLAQAARGRQSARVSVHSVTDGWLAVSLTTTTISMLIEACVYTSSYCSQRLITALQHH